jgi:hypothetical protein
MQQFEHRTLVASGAAEGDQGSMFDVHLLNAFKMWIPH